MAEDDAAKRLILARRARFIAAALAGAGIAAGCSDYDNDGKTKRPDRDASSTPIAERRPADPSVANADGGVTPPSDATVADAGEPDAEPQPCLTPR